METKEVKCFKGENMRNTMHLNDILKVENQFYFHRYTIFISRYGRYTNSGCIKT